MIGLVEPIGFPTSSLRFKAEAMAAIETVDGTAWLKVVHDTFQHALAGKAALFPDQTEIVHVSRISDPDAPIKDALDERCVLVKPDDWTGAAAQVAAPRAGGYDGPVFFECTVPTVHGMTDAGAAIRRSMELIAEASAAA